MNITFFIVLGLAFLSFIIPAAVYGIVSRRAMFNRGGLGSSAFLPAAMVLLPLMLGVRFFLYDGDDFIGSYNFWQIVVPLPVPLPLPLPAVSIPRAAGFRRC